jgi:hypothetical protein
MKINFHTFGDKSFLGLVLPDSTTYIPVDSIAKLAYEDKFETNTNEGPIQRLRIYYFSGITHTTYREDAAQLNSFLSAH